MFADMNENTFEVFNGLLMCVEHLTIFLEALETVSHWHPFAKFKVSLTRLN